jgi:hypothetical protein
MERQMATVGYARASSLGQGHVRSGNVSGPGGLPAKVVSGRHYRERSDGPDDKAQDRRSDGSDRPCQQAAIGGKSGARGVADDMDHVFRAEPSGMWGTLKEFFANTSALDASKLESDSSELIKAVIADFETAEGRSDIQKALRKHFADMTESADCLQRSLASLRERFQQSSMPPHRKMQSPSKLGYVASVRKWQRPLWRAVSWALEAFK